MNIKQKIGFRILNARKEKKLTRKALAQLTDDLSISRINNYERGQRTPGPIEIQQLAKALDVSAAFLMCLTDEKNPKKIMGVGALVPVLNQMQASNYKVAMQALLNDESDFLIPINSQLAAEIGENAFAL